MVEINVGFGRLVMKPVGSETNINQKLLNFCHDLAKVFIMKAQLVKPFIFAPGFRHSPGSNVAKVLK